jgi:hypothetical protein
MRIHTSTLFGERERVRRQHRRGKSPKNNKKENKIRSNTVQTKFDLSVKDGTKKFIRQMMKEIEPWVFHLDN